MSDRFPELARLIDVVARLRAPGGCPWDREQTARTMAPHLLEECYEAIDAITSGNAANESEELGDVLMNIAMIAQISKEGGGYDLEQVATGIADKLIRRHPHVFGEVKAETSGQVLENWERIKREEKPEKKAVLGGVPKDLPALLKAYRIGEKAARVGFDWPDAKGPRAKVQEELEELDEALARGDAAASEAELGDLLFAVVNLARHAKINPEIALRGTIDKFMRRFEHVEKKLGDRLGKASLEEMDRAWDEAKAEEGR